MNSEDVNLELVFLGPQTTHPLRSITGVIIKFDLILSTYAARLLRSQLEISSQNGWLSRSQSAFVNMQEKGYIYIIIFILPIIMILIISYIYYFLLWVIVFVIMIIVY